MRKISLIYSDVQNFIFRVFISTSIHFLLRNFEMEQRALKDENNCLNTNIYYYLETSGGQSSNPYLNVVRFFNTIVK
jgi:hypothetical protein